MQTLHISYQHLLSYDCMTQHKRNLTITLIIMIMIIIMKKLILF